MKGLVFSELMDVVEEEYRLQIVQDVLDETQPASGGAYSAVGNYDHEELVAIVCALSKRLDCPVPALIRQFGTSLFGRFVEKYPEFFAMPQNTFEFLATVEETVHVEVRKLYEDAELPSFEYEYPTAEEMVVVYKSCRPFGDLAEGLIAGCANHYGENIAIRRDDLSNDNETHIRFQLTRQTA